MAGVRAEYKNKLLKKEKGITRNMILLFIFMVLAGLFFISIVVDMNRSDETNIADVALLLSLGSLFVSYTVPEFNNADKYFFDIIEDKIRQKQEELKQISESIELFYLPLHDLLTTYDENVTNRAKSRKIIQINGHKHLAEPRVRGVFEEYVSDGANSRKLLELVNRDIELLQNRFIELKAELKDD